MSVLTRFRQYKFSVKTAGFFPSPTLTAVFIYLFNFKKNTNCSCEKTRKNPLRENSKSRYQNASLTVEASVAFPVFFFAVLYLVQMFSVLRAEVVIAEAGISSARDAAAYSYVAERLADGENAVAETLLKLFNRDIIRDATMTGVFYSRCDKDVLEQAEVAQGFGGIWVNTESAGDKIKTEVYYRVKPTNVLTQEKGKFYVMRLVYRNWTGEGGDLSGGEEGAEESEKVYMTEHGRVYHRKRDCSYIKIDITAVLSEAIGGKRNASGAKYYACEFCSPVLKNGTQVFVTEYGTRFHALSSCSAIKRTVKECALEEVQESYPACSRCGKTEEGDA